MPAAVLGAGGHQQEVFGSRDADEGDASFFLQIIGSSVRQDSVCASGHHHGGEFLALGAVECHQRDRVDVVLVALGRCLDLLGVEDQVGYRGEVAGGLEQLVDVVVAVLAVGLFVEVGAVLRGVEHGLDHAVWGLGSRELE